MENSSWKPVIRNDYQFDHLHRNQVFQPQQQYQLAERQYYLPNLIHRDLSLPKIKTSRQEETTEVEECDGVENFIHDIEIISLILGILSLIKGISSLIGSTLTIFFTKTDLFFVNLPSRILTFLRDLGFMVPEMVESIFSTLEIIFTAMNVKFWFPFEVINNFVHFLGEVLAVISLAMAGLTTFSDLWKDDLDFYVGRIAARFIRNHGCRN